MISHMFPESDLYYADPAQPLTTADGEPDDLDTSWYISDLTGDFFLIYTDERKASAKPQNRKTNISVRVGLTII